MDLVNNRDRREVVYEMLAGIYAPFEAGGNVFYAEGFAELFDGEWIQY